VGHAPVWKNRRNLESRARTLRYRFLEKAAQKRKIQKILTAHHADDQAETFLMRWVQGAGLRGLGGMSLSKPLADDQTIQLVRPLLLISRAEIEAYAKGQGIEFREDETNSSALFLRTRLRRLMKSFREENPNLQNLTALNALTLQADEAYLEKVSCEIWKQKGAYRKRKVFFPLKDFRGFPDSLRYRLLQTMARRLLGEVYALPLETVLKLDDILVGKSGPARYDLPSGLGFFKGKDRFEMFKKPC
jgi:tRNA(Ile)-lysidine synthase TilS/MesJ